MTTSKEEEVYTTHTFVSSFQPTMSPNQDLCKEELSLLQRESLKLLLKPTDDEHKRSISSISGKKHYDDEVELSLLKKDIQSLKLESKISQRNDESSKRDRARYLWNEMISSSSLSTPRDHQDHTLKAALSSIRILNSTSSKDCDNSNAHWLKSYSAQLESLPINFLQTLRQCVPAFNARVADFNDNLFYDMQNQYGLNHLLSKQHNCDFNNDLNPHIKFSSQSSQNLDDVIYHTLQCDQFLGSFMATETTVPQPAHVDFTWERLEQFGQDLRIGFFPLTSDGMFLQVWKRNDDMREKNIYGEIIFIPFGKILTLPATTIHGGGFKSTTATKRQQQQQHQLYGNLRFHVYLAHNHTRLSKNQTTNKYTEPNDKTKELADRYVDSPTMKELQDSLFV